MGAPPTTTTATAASLPRTSSRTTKIRSVAHRFAGAAARSLDDIVAVGVRFDDDDPSFGESLAVRLRPGRMETVAAISGPVKSVALFHKDVVVVDARGALKKVSGESLLDGVKDVYDDGQRLLALQGDDVVDVASRATIARVKDAVSLKGGLVRGATGVYDLAGKLLVAGAVDAVARALLPGGGSDVAVARGKMLTLNNKQLALPFVVQSLCKAAGRWFASSKQGGLVVVDEGVVRPLRPSLRAHQLVAVGNGLLIVSDLFIATSDDGLDFVSRDLASYVRLAEKQAA